MSSKPVPNWSIFRFYPVQCSIGIFQNVIHASAKLVFSQISSEPVINRYIFKCHRSQCPPGIFLYFIQASAQLAFFQISSRPVLNNSYTLKCHPSQCPIGHFFRFNLSQCLIGIFSDAIGASTQLVNFQISSEPVPNSYTFKFHPIQYTIGLF